MNRQRIALACAMSIFALALFVQPADGRIWHMMSGQTFEADFGRVEGNNAIFLIHGKESSYPLITLSVADRLLIGRMVYQQRTTGSASPSVAPAPKESPTESVAPVSAENSPPQLKFGNQPIKADKANEIDVPITDRTALQIVQKSYGKPSASAKMLLALPAGFDPVQKSYPILIVSSTTDGKGSSINSARYNYLPEATDKGYVALAVDGEFGKPDDGDSPDFRWALVSSGLDALAKEWPKSRSWPIATAGVSGGGGYASHQAMMLLQKQAPVIGLFLAVSPWSPTHFMDVLRRTPFPTLHNMPIFMSAGDTDTRVTKDKSESEHASLVGEGFRKIRFEHFPGGHQIHRPHLQAALDWFVEENNKTHPAPASSTR